MPPLTLGCMHMQGGKPAEVPLEECPLPGELPAQTVRCNTVRCPTRALVLMSSSDEACSAHCANVTGGTALVCANSLGYYQPLHECGSSADPRQSVLSNSANVSWTGRCQIYCAGPSCCQPSLLRLACWAAKIRISSSDGRRLEPS